MDDEKQEQYTKDEVDKLFDFLNTQAKLIENQYNLFEETIKRNKKHDTRIILVFTIAIVCISLGFMVCQTVSERNRNNIKVENTSTSYSNSGDTKSIKPQDRR